MKTCFYIGAAAVAMLSVTAVDAQVLGGNIAGGLGGTLSGGMHDMSVITQGRGSLDGSLDAGSLRRSTADITGRTADGVFDTTGTARERTRSGLSGARTKTQSAVNVATGATTAAASNATAVTRQVDATMNVAGSFTGSMDDGATEQGSAARPVALIEGSGEGSVQGLANVSQDEASASAEASAETSAAAQRNDTVATSLHR